jgi:cell division protein ZapB
LGEMHSKDTCKYFKTRTKINNLQEILMADSPNTPETDLALNAQIEAVIERSDRLLLRHEELARTNALLQEQVQALVHERDTLKSRLSAARARIDALIERLPEQSAAAPEVA